jgi:hypothetical protein
VWLGALAGIAAAVIVVWLRAAWRRRGRSRIAVARARRALAGERAAEALLADAGYAVTARQARRAWQVRLDGEPIDIDLRADLLAEADGRTYVAEVKTGAAAPRIDTAATRRQLLEYQVAYGVDGVLLVDAEAGAVRVVDFPDVTSEPANDAPETHRARPWIAIALVVGALAGHYLW